MTTRSNNGTGPKVAVRFEASMSYFMMAPGDTIGDLAGHLARLSEQRGATPLTIALTFPRAPKRILH